MKPFSGFQIVYSMTLPLMLMFSSSYSAFNPTQLDFYDNTDNHLMYIVFHYEGDRLTGRTVYMADGTFKREVNLVPDPAVAGGRLSETSFDFNGDTSFVTTYRNEAGKTSFTIKDQFKLDHVGGAVSYSTATPDDYLITYQDNSFASHIAYENLPDGTPSKVYVYDAAGQMEYYGVFATTGINSNRANRLGGSPQAVVSPRGGAGFDIRLNLSAPGVVKCELLTLSGRVAGVLLNESVPKGQFLRSISTIRQAPVSSGVYLMVVSVNGKVVSSRRYLSESVVSGGVK